MTGSLGDSRPFPMKEAEFVAMMAAMMALHALAIDAMLPALAVMASELGVTNDNDRQLVVALYLVAGGAVALIPGPIVDRVGRRPVALVCLAAYFLISAASAFVRDFTTLLVLRCLLGAFTSALITVPLAVVRDRFEGDRMARAQSTIAMIFMVMPMLAPLMGQGVMAVAGWRAIFVFMGILGLSAGIWVWSRLPETLHEDYRQEFNLARILANMRLAVTRRETLGYVIAGALMQALILGYINSSQQLVAEALGAGEWFPTIFGACAAAMIVTNFVNSRIVERFGARRVSQSATLALIVIALLHSTFAFSGNETLLIFAVLMALTMCMVSFMGANFQAIAMQPFGRIAGSAASAMNFVRLLFGSLLGLAIGRMFDGTARPLTLAIVLIGVGILLLVLFSERGRLFRRLNYPEAT